MKRTWPVVAVVIIAAVTVFSFWPAADNGFVDWDDDENLTDNPHFRGLGWEQVRWAFTTRTLLVYQPLSWLAFSAQYVVWGGADARGFHLTSIGLHVVVAVLFYFLVLRLLDLTDYRRDLTTFTAAVAAILFAVHPLRVECVAWASGQPYLLAAIFLMLTLLAYLRAQAAPATRRRWLAVSLGCYALSLLSKSVGVPLPVLLIILDVYPLRAVRVTLADASRLVEKIPYFLLSTAGVAVGLWANAEAEPSAFDLPTTLASASFGLMFYLWNTLIPLGLSPVYEMPAQGAWSNVQSVAFVLISGVAAVCMTVAAVLARRRTPWFTAAWAVYVVQLLPVLGFVRHTGQIAADRYSYFACLPWAIMIACGLTAALAYASRLAEKAPAKLGRGFCVVLFCVIVASLSALTRTQTRVWSDAITLWEHALRQPATTLFGDSKIVHSNLGIAYSRAGDSERGLPHLERALALAPDDPDVHVNIGNAYRLLGRWEPAVRHFRQATELFPGDAAVFHALGEALTRTGRMQDSRDALERAVELRPDDPRYVGDLAWFLTICPAPRLRDPPRGAELAEQAVALTDGRSAEAWRRLAAIYSLVGRFSDAAEAAQQALEAGPDADPAVRDQIAAERDRYRAGRPYSLP
jgi:tetratricopeptide (TPR) repeat protein